MTTRLNAADLFCGAGGTSIGAELSGAARVRFAVNHWDVAVQTHAANFPHAKHVNSRLDQVRPSECPKIDLLFASPECTHHSRARGGRPTSDQQRAGAWELLPWIEHHRPSFVVVENVVEFQEWGPVGDNGRPLKKYRGRFFAAWLQAIEAAGYRVEVCRLNAADFGAATSRERLFVLCRKGNRPPRVPDPTHAKAQGPSLPGFEMELWRSAVDVLDWSIPCISIFDRRRPLADSTLLRIASGIRRHVHHGGRSVAFISSYYGNGGSSSIVDPLPTIVTKDRHALVVASCDATEKVRRPPTSDAERELMDVMRSSGVTDIGFRMLANHELAAAQGFPPGYVFEGTKTEVTKQIGNSVSPPVAKAITSALAS